MSVTNLSRNEERGTKPSRRAESAKPPAHTASLSNPAETTVENATQLETQFQLGDTVIEAVDQLTGLSADEIEVVADRLLDGARETEDVLRELARRVREHGVLANERLANFINAANKCAETAREMQSALAESGSYSQVDPQAHNKASPADLNALEAEIEAIRIERSPPTQPSD